MDSIFVVQMFLKIKQMLKQQNPGLNMQALKIKKVTLIAKSKQGRAQATLMTGQSASYPATIPGSPRMFQTQAPRSFSRVVLHSASASSQGKVQVELQGNIKIQKIIVTVKGLHSGGVSHPVPMPRPTRPRRGRGI
jgi:hypothetical protein